MYPADFEADTSHLTLEEDGAYNRLLRLMWMTPGCSLPDDDAWIMRRMRCDMATYERVVKPLIAEFFQRQKGRVFSARLTREFAKADETHKKRSQAGKMGGRPPKSLKTNDVSKSRAKAGTKQPEPEPEPVKEEANASSKNKRGSRLPDGWLLPREWGEWALGEGWNEQTVRDQADRFRDYWISAPGQKGVKRDWYATWRNWMRNSNAPQLKAIPGGRHDQPAHDSNRLQRIVSAAAAGSSGQDWG
jgi:uncharacterized protein YdaU (DUF1376 family)